MCIFIKHLGEGNKYEEKLIKEGLHTQHTHTHSHSQEIFSQKWTLLNLVKSRWGEDWAKSINLKFKWEKNERVGDSTRLICRLSSALKLRFK